MKIVCLVAALLAYSSPASAATGEGPLLVKNGHPMFLPLSSPPLSSAAPESSVTANLSYSSTYLVEKTKTWNFGIDLETAILDFQLKRQVLPGTEIGLDFPVIRYGSGFLDDPIDSYHHALGMDDAYGRNERPRNVFSCRVLNNGQLVMQGKPNRTALGDVTAEVKQVVYSATPLVISGQVFLTLPTGDASLSYGSGRTNGGFAVLANVEFPRDVILYINAGAVFFDKLAGVQDLPLKDSAFGGFGMEWVYSPRIAFNVQMTAQSSPYPVTGDFSVDDPALIGTFGGRYRFTDRSSIGLALSEDLNAAGSPDISLSIDFRRKY